MRIVPLRGHRFVKAGRDVSSVVAPPYDQISPDMQDRLEAMSPWNIVRVTLPRDEGAEGRYRQARAVLEQWQRDRVWTHDDEPALYPYHQTYRVDGVEVTRKGFVALGEVTPYSAGVVLPHERTHAGPKKDRLELLEATGADIGLLFMLVSDPNGDVMEITTPKDEPR